VILVGGVGGGGDSAGALSIATALRMAGADAAVLGMLNCAVGDVQRAERLAGSLLAVRPDSWAGGRFFEPHIAGLGWDVYAICLREGLEKALEGLDYLKSMGARAVVGVDFGGDVPVKGDEPEVGSAFEDAMALASVVQGWGRGRPRRGMLGAELGGRIPTPILAENAAEIAGDGGYLGAYEPQGEALREFLRTARWLLSRVSSFMLTAYVDALEGRLGERQYDVAYFHGTFKVEPHHRYIYVFKAEAVAQFNKLTQLAARVGDLTRLEKAKRGVKPRSGLANWERAIANLARRKWNYRELLHH